MGNTAPTIFCRGPVLLGGGEKRDSGREGKRNGPLGRKKCAVVGPLT